MRWYHSVAYFFGGFFLVNFLPHFLAGISGSPFQSPFATPPGKGLSPSATNVAWGAVNLIVAYLLLVRVGHFDLRNWRHALAFGIAFLGGGFLLAHSFAPFHGGLR
jgi:hypothetical protein